MKMREVLRYAASQFASTARGDSVLTSRAFASSSPKLILLQERTEMR